MQRGAYGFVLNKFPYFRKAMLNICLIEDEEKVAGFITRGLEEQGYHVVNYRDGASASDAVSMHHYDLIILDLMLPDIHGFDLCRQIRKFDQQVPILMLSALGGLSDKVEGLQIGADDYLVKPFHFSELLARIEALLRRNRPQPTKQDGDVLTFGDLKLDLKSKTAERAGQEIILTSKEYGLLELFMKHPNRTLARDYIAEQVWGIQFDTGTNFIDVYVNYLRKKIEKDFDGKLIHTVIGMGYILKNK